MHARKVNSINIFLYSHEDVEQECAAVIKFVYLAVISPFFIMWFEAAAISLIQNDLLTVAFTLIKC